MQRLWLILPSLAGTLAASPARAQEVGPPPLEIGGIFSGIVAFGSEDGPAVVIGAGPRVTVNLTRKVAVDLAAEVIGPTESSGTTGLYQSQLEFRVRRSPDGKRTLSVTVGATGLFYYRRAPEMRSPRLDGSQVVYPPYRTFLVRAPTTLVLGVAREEVVARHVSTCLALQTYLGSVGGVALRASVGVSFGMGGYR